ncbi:MAG: hypothetical protein U0K35_08880, partial [Prevotella sp.]|nr:hypothetical protein [Prevotella sp.]
MRVYAGRMIASNIHNNSVQNITEHTNNGKSKDSIGSKKHITVMTLCSSSLPVFALLTLSEKTYNTLGNDTRFSAYTD